MSARHTPVRNTKPAAPRPGSHAEALRREAAEGGGCTPLSSFPTRGALEQSRPRGGFSFLERETHNSESPIQNPTKGRPSDSHSASPGSQYACCPGPLSGAHSRRHQPNGAGPPPRGGASATAELQADPVVHHDGAGPWPLTGRAYTSLRKFQQIQASIARGPNGKGRCCPARDRGGWLCAGGRATPSLGFPQPALPVHRLPHRGRSRAPHCSPRGPARPDAAAWLAPHPHATTALGPRLPGPAWRGRWSQIHGSLNPDFIFALRSLRLRSIVYNPVERTVFNEQGDHSELCTQLALHKCY